jgi:diguanylate cyclase (GGDEF)-like protein
MSKEESITDNLTYLYNQKYFYNYMDRKINENPEGDTMMSLVMFDIDHFKHINDTYGHLTGDYVLKEVARLIKNSIRKNDVAARYGGEEFTVILPDMNSEDAYIVAERIRESIEQHIFLMNGHKITITISGGVAEYPKVASNVSELVSYADRAMYVGAKFKGRNKVKIYDEKPCLAE